MQTGPDAPTRPGLEHTSRTVGEARPFKLPSVSQTTRWSCTRCRRVFPLRDSWAVEVEGRDRVLRFVVCPRCALSFALPPPTVVDLAQLRGDGPTAVALRGFLEEVEAVARVRGEDHAERVTVRAADLRAYAFQHGITAPAFARLLEIEGIASPV